MPTVSDQIRHAAAERPGVPVKISTAMLRALEQELGHELEYLPLAQDGGHGAGSGGFWIFDEIKLIAVHLP